MQLLDDIGRVVKVETFSWEAHLYGPCPPLALEPTRTRCSLFAHAFTRVEAHSRTHRRVWFGDGVGVQDSQRPEQRDSAGGDRAGAVTRELPRRVQNDPAGTVACQQTVLCPCACECSRVRVCGVHDLCVHFPSRPRLVCLPPSINARFVIAEDTAVVEDVAFLLDAGGIVVANASALPAVVAHYAHGPASVRRTIAQQGHDAFLAMPSWQTLAPCVQELLRDNGCRPLLIPAVGSHRVLL
jgi:hypothetical protein